jgi:hypothetical protein
MGMANNLCIENKAEGREDYSGYLEESLDILMPNRSH